MSTIGRSSRQPLSFEGCLEYSHGAKDEPAWCAVYQLYWPGCRLEDMRQDGEHQRRGVDRMALRPNDTWAFIDEKVRSIEYPGDLLLELRSDIRRWTPGWLIDPKKQCSHVAHLYLPDELCFLLPFDELQRAWARHEHQWKQLAMHGMSREETQGWIRQPGNARRCGANGFGLVRAHSGHNGRVWNTLNLFVPERALFDALSDAMVATWRAP